MPARSRLLVYTCELMAPQTSLFRELCRFYSAGPAGSMHLVLEVEAKMGIAKNLLKTAAKRVTTRLMDRVGGRVVAMATDTSSDAPDAFYAPKRSLYQDMVAEEPSSKEE